MVTAECARGRLMTPGSAYTKLFMFLTMPRRRECAKSVSEVNSDLTMWWSWLLASESGAGSVMPMLALACTTCRRTVEMATVRWSRVFRSVVSACPMRMATSSTIPQYLLRAAMRGIYFSVFFVSLLSQPRSLHNPTSTRMKVHSFLFTLLWSGSGVAGTPLT